MTETKVPDYQYTLHVSAFTKVNLALRVVGRREDGLHLLDMVVAPTTFGDSVELRLGSVTGKVTLTLEGGTDGSLSDAVAALVDEGSEHNLAVRAWHWFFSVVGVGNPGGQIKIIKVVPIGGGLGGGSADAAAVIRGLMTLLARGELGGGRNINSDELAAASVVLGADVPVLIKGHWARVRGVGEIVEPLSLPAFEGRSIAICWPGVGLNTAQVFRMFRESGSAFSVPHRGLGGRELFINDLEMSARKLEPRVGLVLDALRGAGFGGDAGLGSVVMTGSGSCVVVVSGETRGLQTPTGEMGVRGKGDEGIEIKQTGRTEEFFDGVRAALSKFEWVRVFPALLGGAVEYKS